MEGVELKTTCKNQIPVILARMFPIVTDNQAGLKYFPGVHPCGWGLVTSLDAPGFFILKGDE